MAIKRGSASTKPLGFNHLAECQIGPTCALFPPGVRRSILKPRLMIALLITGVLVISAGAQDSSDIHPITSGMESLPKQPSTSKAVMQAQLGVAGPQDTPQQYLEQMQAALQAMSGDLGQIAQATHDGKISRAQEAYLAFEQYYVGLSSSNPDETIVVDVWSTPAEMKPEADPTKFSQGFAVAGLNAANRLQFTQRRIANSIKMGFPLGEFWIQTDFDSIDDSLRLAALSVANEADRRALQQLQTQTRRLRLWGDWLIDQNRHMALANYYISPSPLDNDEQFQNTVTCTKFLLSMLASGRLEDEDRSCW